MSASSNGRPDKIDAPFCLCQQTDPLSGDRDGEAGSATDFILNSIVDGVFAVDEQWRITYFNHAAEVLTGWSRQDVIGKPCREIFRSDACGESCFLAESFREGKPVYHKSLFMTHADGHQVAVNINAIPLINKAGKVVGGVEIFRDVRTLMNRALILDNIADGLFTVDTEWRITSFNRAAEKLTGRTLAEVLGKKCSEVFQTNICGEDCAVAASMCTGRPQTNRCISITDAEGEAIPVSICASPLLDNQGNMIGGVETLRDLRMVNVQQTLRPKRYKCEEIISNSPAMKRIFEILPPIAASRSNVLITGESGTGKELVARAIHNLSESKKGPFVAVNCGALPDTLLEAELFGYKAGAFTDAKQDRAGRFAAAAGGTLLLDEIGDVPQPVQVKLLRVIETKLYEPLGSNVSVPANVRIVAATNHDLKALVLEGKFRDDLFYRLNVANLYLPPLRERLEDIPLLIEHFINSFNTERGKDIGGVSDAAMGLLLRHDFPGNVRELQNIIEYAFILCPGGLIQPEHLPEPFASRTVDAEESSAPLILGSQSLTMEEIEKRAILESLKRNEWRRMATCRELDISKDTLRRKIERYGIEEEPLN